MKANRRAQPKDAKSRHGNLVAGRRNVGLVVKSSTTRCGCTRHMGPAPGSITLPPCSPGSSPLRAAFADGLRPGLTQTARDGLTNGRDGETPLDRTEKHRHDRRDGNPGLYF